MSDQKAFSKYNCMKGALLERSVSFHAHKPFKQINFHQQQQQYKITFIKEANPTEHQPQQTPVVVTSSAVPSKRIFRPNNARSSSLTSSLPGQSITEKCVYCIENEYRKEIKEAFNRFIDNNGPFNKCTCEILKKSIAYSKSARYTNYRKLSLQSPTDTTSDGNDKNDKFDFYYKNITNSLNKLSSFDSDNDVVNENKNENNTTKNRNEVFSNIYTNSTMSMVGGSNQTKTNATHNPSLTRANSNTDLHSAINLQDIERIKEKYTNYLLNKEKMKQQEQQQQKPMFLKRAATTLHRSKTTFKYNKSEVISSITSAINQLSSSTNSNKNEKKFCILNENQSFQSLSKDSSSKEEDVESLKNESSLKYIDMVRIENNNDSVFENKKEDENDLIADSELLASNSCIKLNTDIAVNMENANDIHIENVPDMEEVTTTLIQPKSNMVGNNNNLYNGFGIVSGGNNINNGGNVKGTPRPNEFILPPIGEHELNLASTNSHNHRQSSTGTKSIRADSGIGDLDHHNNNNNNNGWVYSPNGSDNGNNDYVEINKENFQKKNTLKKNPTSSTLYSYGQSSNISKQTHSTSVFSSKNSNHGGNYVDMSNSSTIKVNRKSSNVNMNKQNDENSYSQKQNSAPNSQSVVKRTESDLSINSKPNLVRQNSQFIRKNSMRQPQQQQQQQQQAHQQPVPKPRQQNSTESNIQRSQSLQRQTSFMTDTANTKKQTNKINQQANIKQRNSFTSNTNSNNNNNKSNNKQQLTTNQANNTRPSTSTSHRNQPPHQQQQQQQQQTNSQQQNKTSKLNTYEQNEPSNQPDFDLKGHFNDSDMTELTKYRINEWLDEVERCTSLRPPSALSWFGASTTARVINHHSSNNKNHDTSGNFNSNDNDFDLSEYDSSDEQIIEYNRVVDKTYCVVYDK